MTDYKFIKRNCFAWNDKRKRCNALSRACPKGKCGFYKSKEQYEAELINGLVKCKNCVFAKPDENMSERNWTAYQCTNQDSEYYRCLLNVTPSGNKEQEITWYGCRYGEKKGECDEC